MKTCIQMEGPSPDGPRSGGRRTLQIGITDFVFYKSGFTPRSASLEGSRPCEPRTLGGSRPPDGLVRYTQKKTRPEAGFHRPVAFTLIELLAVIAVIGILAALLFPGLSTARQSANRAKTRVQFTQWAAAIESFRSEYGYYPALHSSHLVNPSGQNTDASTLHLFHDILAGRRRDGSALPAITAGTNGQYPEAQNRKLIRFHSFAESEFTAPDSPSPNLLRDAFGNTDIAVLEDANLDGVINAADFSGGLPAVNGLSPSSADFPAVGIHAGVIFYAPSPGATLANPDFIFSWK